MEPLLAWTPCIALNGLEYYTHEAIPEFQGKIMMGVMSGFNDPLPGRLIMIELSEDGQAAESQEAFFGSFNQRIRDIAVNPYTGGFYLAFNGESYPGNPPNIIKEFSTADPSLVPTPVVKPVLVQPVPARDRATVMATDGAVGGPVVVRDMTGRIVYEGTVNSSTFELNLSGWSAGRYIVWTAVGAADLMVH